MADMLLDRNDCVLVIIDIQEKLLPVMWEKERVMDNSLRLAKFASVIDLPVVVTEQDKLGPTIEPLREALAEYDPIAKISFDCFGCEPFAERIAELGRHTLLLCGIESHICVAQTALTGLDAHEVHLISDAASSRVEHNWRIAQRRLDGAGATITSTEMVIYELLRAAGTDEFRATLPLVK